MIICVILHTKICELALSLVDKWIFIMTNSIKNSDTAKLLNDHHTRMQSVTLHDLFQQDTQRFEKYSIEYQDLFLDYSKNICTDETLGLLFKLATDCGFDSHRQQLFMVDDTESNQPVSLHTALRDYTSTSLIVNGKDIADEVRALRTQMCSVCVDLADRQPAITDIVSLGIGGSHLGAEMACRALQSFKRTSATVHFVSTAGGGELENLLAELNPKHTCFIAISKKFSTRDTLINAQYAKAWLGNYASEHFLAVTANVSKATEFGIKPDNCLTMQDSVSGRYSLFSSAGLPLAIYLGMEAFEEFLEGARQMDRHFQSTALSDNMPAIMALLGIWYNNFYGAQSHAILCYDPKLELFPIYLQQLEMESNGKCVSRDGRVVDYDTAPIIWGGSALDGQHAYYQLLHQGTRLVPADFIISANTSHQADQHQAWPHANCFAQSHALMEGVETESLERMHPGNRPTNTIMLRELTPRTLGALIVLYEHKTYTESLIWKIYSFDQWGVEYGKQLSDRIFDSLSNNQTASLTELDQSTRGLIDRYLAWRK